MDNLEPRNKINWDCFWLFQTAVFSLRSHDVHTQCGCVLVKDNILISAGYNGFIRGVEPDGLPLTRPEKYTFMVHAEANAIYNAARNGQSTLGAIAYISGNPCLQCYQALIQAGIKEIVVTDYSNPSRVDTVEYTRDLLKISKAMGEKTVPINFINKELICRGTYTPSGVPLIELVKNFSKKE